MIGHWTLSTCPLSLRTNCLGALNFNKEYVHWGQLNSMKIQVIIMSRTISMCRTGVPLFYFHKLQHISTAIPQQFSFTIACVQNRSHIATILNPGHLTKSLIPSLFLHHKCTNLVPTETEKHRHQTENTKSKFEYSRIVKNLTITSLLSKSLWLAARTTPPLHSQSEICLQFGFYFTPEWQKPFPYNLLPVLVSHDVFMYP